jgi:hypothetical protein
MAECLFAYTHTIIIIIIFVVCLSHPSTTRESVFLSETKGGNKVLFFFFFFSVGCLFQRLGMSPAFNVHWSECEIERERERKWWIVRSCGCNIPPPSSTSSSPPQPFEHKERTVRKERTRSWRWETTVDGMTHTHTRRKLLHPPTNGKRKNFSISILWEEM